jgi:hypothetical protein
MRFSERIALRRRLWWCEPGKWRNWESYRGLLHRVTDTHRMRSRDDSDEAWRCCDRWQRCLNNKWNGREFAQRHGCRVPELFWHGRRTSRLPLDALPSKYVLRPVWGAHGEGTYVMVNGRDLLHERDYSREDLLDEIRRRHGWLARFPLLAEEFVTEATGQQLQPTEYKIYVFGDKIGAINAVRRNGRKARDSFYDEAWRRFPEPLEVSNPADDDVPAPSCLDEMLACARRLGTACRTFMRADFYGGPRGAVFGEFSSTPVNGREFTPFGDRYLGDLWDAECGDLI